MTSCRTWSKAAKPGEEITAFLVTDHRSLRKYGLGCVPPFPMPLGHHLRTGYLMRGARFRTRRSGQNRRAGVRGNGRAIRTARPPTDASRSSAGLARLQPLSERCASRAQSLHRADPGRAILRHRDRDRRSRTYAGIKTDANARAIDADGQPIEGLYAAGNDMASIMGRQLPARRHHASARR